MDKFCVGKRMVNKKLPPTFFSQKAVNDRKFGDAYERRFKKKIEEWIGCTFDAGKSGWEQIDFINKENKIAIELKTRRTKKWDYMDIMLSKSKYTAARKLMRKGYKVYVFWKFRDELCFWNVPLMLKNVREDLGGRTDRGYNETAKCIFIPTSILHDFKAYPSYIDYMETNKIVNV